MDLKPKILILDDDVLSLELYSRELSGDYQVTKSVSVMETRRYLKEISPTILVLEPAVNQDEGWDLMHEIQESSNPPLIILCSVEDDRRSGFRHGAHAFLVKPVLPTTLHELINRICSNVSLDV